MKKKKKTHDQQFVLREKKTRPIAISRVLRAFSDGPTDRPTDRQTDRPTDRVAYRVACTRNSDHLSRFSLAIFLFERTWQVFTQGFSSEHSGSGGGLTSHEYLVQPQSSSTLTSSHFEGHSSIFSFSGPSHGRLLHSHFAQPQSSTFKDQDLRLMGR